MTAMAQKTRRRMVSAAPVRELGFNARGQVHRVGIVVRVSTARQAANDEGSLATQLQRTRAHIDYKRACGEDLYEAGVYELPAVSGKHSLRHPEMLRLEQDIRSGRVNTILCTELSRASRNVGEFLEFVELLNEHDCSFVCLKQAVDTTTPLGRLLLVFLVALAQFERETTAERTKDAMAARSERGLWNGGRLYGYEADPERKGYLSVVDLEADVIQFAFLTYIACGSIARTVAALNAAGYRTRAFTSRNGVEHPGGTFRISNVQYLLKNPAYIGMKDVSTRTGQGEEDRLVPAVWDAIIERDTFDEVQRLMTANAKTRTNQARQFQHVYVLSNGLLVCGECCSNFEGRSGIGHLGVRYFYYACRNKDCSVRVAALEIEGIILERLRLLATSDGVLDGLVFATNQRLNKQLPELQTRKRALGRELSDIKGQIDRLLVTLSRLDGEPGRSSVTTKLGELEQRRRSLESTLAEVDDALRHVQGAALSADAVREALGQITEIYAHLKPLEQKELFRLLVKRAEVSERRIRLELYGDALQEGVQGESLQVHGGQRFETPDRLPESVTQSVVLYEFPVRLRGLRVHSRLQNLRRAAYAGAVACSPNQ